MFEAKDGDTPVGSVVCTTDGETLFVEKLETQIGAGYNFYQSRCEANLVYREVCAVRGEKLLNEIQRSFDRIEKNFREDFRLNREESRLVAKDNREELARSMNCLLYTSRCV